MSENTTRSTGPLKIIRQPAPPELAAMLLCMLVLGGCSSNAPFTRVPVGGYVSIDSAPLKSGTIRFIPTDGTQGPAAVATIEEGYFELASEEGPLVGKHRIEIEATNHLGFEIDDEQAYARQVQSGKAVPKNPVPDAFNRQSKLVVDLDEEGNTDLEYRLTSAGVLADSR